MVKQFLVKAVLGLSIFVVLLYFILWALSPFLVQTFSKQALSEFGVSLSEASSVRYNPFKSRLIVQDFELLKASKSPLKVQLGTFELDLFKAIWGDIYIHEFAVEGLDVEINAKNNRLIIAGFELPTESAASEELEDDGLEDDVPKGEQLKGLILPKFTLRNSHITYMDDDRTEAFYIQSLVVSDADIRSLQQKLNVDLKAEFQKSTISVLSVIDLKGGIGSIKSEVDMKGLNLEFVKPLLAEQGVVLHSGILGVHIEPHVNLANDSFDMSMKGLKVRLKNFHAVHQQQVIKIKEEVLLELNDIHIRDDKVSIDSVVIDSLQAALEMGGSESTSGDDEAGDIKGVNAENAKIEEGEAEEVKPEQADVGTSEEQVPAVVINLIEFRGESSFDFKDKSVSPAYERIFFIDKAQISRLDSANGGMSPFELKIRSNDYAQVEMAGSVAAFSDPVDLNLSGVLKEVSLPAVSSYIKESIGFELKTGQLDSEIKVSVNNSEIEGDVSLHLRGLNMQKADKELTSGLKAQTSVPLNYALGMLQDKNGNVKIKIPLKGRVDDPDFGVRSFMAILTKKAVMSATKSYLMKTFVPYANVVSVAMAAGSHVLKLRFNDLPYTSEQVDMGESQKKYLEQFSRLMKEKNKAQVKICGVATPTDIGSLPQPLESDKKNYEKNIAALKKVAKQRAENFKAMAVEVGGIESSRMLICTPSVDLGKSAKPKITIGI